ncbi:hypothetical protein CesoFtcFv8_027561 [Champsocephalus esox]|uniref:Uncharacterized protein n=2 Tax=Champsocephalus TaxID=52236 RepID=A0AAN8BT10_CHAGU|nr:hypothetical protein CesoFtcFv8_027561 [Champsocephalus esox]KAK5891256.1 hypothetical protein CgunFtcFv8_018530 [Champsocephalus gunnari]
MLAQPALGHLPGSTPCRHFGSARTSFLEDRGRSLAFLEVGGTASQSQPASEPTVRTGATVDEGRVGGVGI